jgi:hypothetical protein
MQGPTHKSKEVEWDHAKLRFSGELDLLCHAVRFAVLPVPSGIQGSKW